MSRCFPEKGATSEAQRSPVHRATWIVSCLRSADARLKYAVRPSGSNESENSGASVETTPGANRRGSRSGAGDTYGGGAGGAAGGAALPCAPEVEPAGADAPHA